MHAGAASAAPPQHRQLQGILHQPWKAGHRDGLLLRGYAGRAAGNMNMYMKHEHVTKSSTPPVPLHSASYGAANGLHECWLRAAMMVYLTACWACQHCVCACCAVVERSLNIAHGIGLGCVAQCFGCALTCGCVSSGNYSQRQSLGLSCAKRADQSSHLRHMPQAAEAVMCSKPKHAR